MSSFFFYLCGGVTWRLARWSFSLMSCSSCCCVLMSAWRMRVLSSSCSFSWFITQSWGCCSWYMDDDDCCCCCCCVCCCWKDMKKAVGNRHDKSLAVFFCTLLWFFFWRSYCKCGIWGDNQMSHIMVYSCDGESTSSFPLFLWNRSKNDTDEWFIWEIHKQYVESYNKIHLSDIILMLISFFELSFSLGFITQSYN